jgi:hypothetical protein
MDMVSLLMNSADNTLYGDIRYSSYTLLYLGLGRRIALRLILGEMWCQFSSKTTTVLR